MSNQEAGRVRISVLERLRQPVGPPRRARVGPRSVGGMPHVSLLPAEIREAGTAAARRRRLAVVVVLVAAASVGAVAVAGSANQAATARLRDASARTSSLNAQIAKFSDVRTLQSRIALGEAAVEVGGSTRIDWNEQFADIEADLPSGYRVTSIAASGATPLADYPQGSTPLEPRRAATVTMTITTGTVGQEFSSYLRLLRTIHAYADANATYSVNAGVTTVVLTVHLNQKAIVASDKTESP